MINKGRLFVLACGLLISCQPSQTPEEKRIADSLALREAYGESPILGAEESLEHFQLEDGFAIELVASEPLVTAPVAMTFDETGRMWVVEMPSYMPDTVGTGEDTPTGRIAVLEDTDGDGKMDRRSIFMDSLVLPRAVCLVEDGILVAEPPYLWFVKNNNGVAGEKTLVDAEYAVGGNVEHQPNGLYRALDNWIYNAKSSKRYRKKGDSWLIERTLFRGQWGISQDNQGRLFYNHNSANLLGDYFPPRFGATNPSQKNLSGYNERIVSDNRVYPIRPTPGVNRGYRPGTLDDSLRLVHFTAASGPVIYRGGLFGEDYAGNAFTPEPSANLVKRNRIDYRINRVSGKQAYEGKEFLASTDERFRPVSAYNGPDGALYLVDMYRGIIQHVTYLTDYLKSEIRMRELTTPLDRGRIYRIVPAGSLGTDGRDRAEDHSARSVVFPREPEKLVALLNHENGWVRDKAQQLLVDGRHTEIVPLLREKLNAGPASGNDQAFGAIHALWTLEGLYALRWEDLKPWITGSNELLAAQALTAIPSVASRGNHEDILRTIRPLAVKKELAPYLAFLLPSLQPFAPGAIDGFLMELARQYPQDPYVSDAIISNLDGKEEAFLKQLNQWNSDSALTIKEHLNEVLDDIREREQARLKRELLKELSRGQELYRNICQTCHGADGKGIRSLAPPLNNSEWVTGDKHRLAAIVLYGLTGPVDVDGHHYGEDEISGEMPGIGNNDALSDYDVAQILSFVRNAWNNQAELVSPDDVSRVREQLKDREGAFTAEELKELSF